MDDIIKLPKEKEHLVLDNLNMVRYVLNKRLHIHPNHSSYEDYYQEGVIGLILAAIKFDESKGFQFSTYAFSIIMGMIQRYRRDFEYTIRYPRTLKNVLFKVLRYSNQGFTPREIEEITGISFKEINEALNMYNVSSLDQEVYINDDSSIFVSDTIADTRDLYAEVLDEEHVLDTIQQISESLNNEIHRGIWEDYIYSTLYGDKLPQQYFAKKYNISQPVVSRILIKLKKNFAEKLIS